MPKKKNKRTNKQRGWHGDSLGHFKAWQKGKGKGGRSSSRQVGRRGLGIGAGFVLITMGASYFFFRYWTDFEELMESTGMPWVDYIFDIIVIAIIILGGILVAKS